MLHRYIEDETDVSWSNQALGWSARHILV